MAKKFVWPIICVIIFSCAKKPEYDTVFKVAEQTHRFQDFDTDSVYVYLPSTLDAPRNVVTKAPFHQDQEILVKLKWTKEGLSVFAPDDDFRFDFSRNQKPIFTIPGRYRAYKCATNNIGECTNREEEDIDTPWEKRPYFDPNLERIDFSRSLTTMDIWYDDGCFVEKNSRLKDYELKKGVINIELEREFRISSSKSCIFKYLRSTSGIQDFSFKTTFFYSLVRLKDISSPDYKKFNYPHLDQDKFGYFKNTIKTLGDNFRRSKKTYLLNRWNPKRADLTYYLSNSFDEPGMEVFKDTTIKAVEDINKILEKAEVPFKVKLKEAEEKKSGDLRYNTIVLITDPLRNGLLGYGPTVTNPITGEIIQGHINMYAGVLRSMVPSVYEKMIRLSHLELKLKYMGGEGRTVSPSIEGAGPTSGEEKLARKAPAFSKPENPYLKMNPDYWSMTNPQDPPTNLKVKNSFMERIDFFTKHSSYPSELYLSGGRYKNFIPGIKEFKEIWAGNGTLFKWDDLSSAQKKKITKMILPHIYRTTFIHEFGHNLGLRHNFMGSVDEKHFYNEEDKINFFFFNENKSSGEDFRAPQYSSIMDYGYSELNELPIFGKYDIAALRYGYARKVELSERDDQPKKLVKLGKKGINPLHITRLVDYKFCTDENINTNPMCNRFDEGVTFTDIMKHYKTKYEGDFFLSNFRNESTNFNRYANIGYFWWRYSQFKMIRKIFETYESYLVSVLRTAPKSKYARRDVISKKLKECEAKVDDPFCNAFLDLYEASSIAGKFFLDIIKTPEHTCLIESKGKPITLNLRSFHGYLDLIKAPTTCFDKNLLKKLAGSSLKHWKILGERGRFLTDVNENDPRYKYASDISARGIWLDKALAMQFLMGRNLPTNKVDDPELSFMEHPVIGPLVDDLNYNFFDQTAMEKVSRYVDEFGVEVKDVNKETNTIRFQEKDNPEITPQVSATLNYFLDLPWRSSFRLSRVLINAAENYLQTTSPKISGQAKMDRDFYRVKKIGDHLSFNQAIYGQNYIMGDGFIYAAANNNLLARNLITPLNYFKMDENPEIGVYLEANSMDFLTLITKIRGRKNNPNVNFPQRTDSLGFPIVKRLESYFVDFPKNLKALGIRGGMTLKKIHEMALKNSNLTEIDFIEAFGEIDGKKFFPNYSPSEIAEIERAYKKVSGEIDCINMSIPDLERTISMAKMVEGGASIESILTEDDPRIKFILSQMKSGEILKIKNWLLETTIMPKDFPLKDLYSMKLADLDYMKESLEFRDLEELEYTLKFLPSY